MSDRAEQRVAAYYAGEALRAKTGRTWNQTLDIKRYFSKEQPVPNDVVAEIGKKVANELKARLPADWFDVQSDDYDEVIEWLHFEFNDIACAVLSSQEGNYVKEFDNLLTSLYDWADEKRIWIQ